MLLLDEEGQQMGVYATAEAISLAYERGYDLVEVSGKQNPPTCKMLDYGKYKYRVSKRQHEARKKQKQILIKEIKFRPKTEEHDFQFKRKRAEQFLCAGNKVKVSVQFRGRELNYKEIGLASATRFAEELKEFGSPEQAPKFEGRVIAFVISPHKK